MSTNTNAVIYCRVSTLHQADNSSLESQESKLRAYADLRGLNVVACVVEAGVSGGVPLADRPEGARVAALVASGAVGHVLALKLDRLFRDTADALVTTRDWDRVGAALHLADLGGMAVDSSSAVGRMFLTMMAGFAEMEKSLIRERLDVGKAVKKARGGYVGGQVPFGWERDGMGDLVPVESEQDVIREAQHLHTLGWSLRAIGRELHRAGLTTRGGGSKWSPATVKRAIEAKPMAA